MELTLELLLSKSRCTEQQLPSVRTRRSKFSARCSSLTFPCYPFILQLRTLNLWGLNLRSLNESVLSLVPNLQTLSLASNALDESALASIAASCPKVRELYLRRNNIRDVLALVFLSQLPCLEILWLEDNPVTIDPACRAVILRCCPRLTKLDQGDVSESDRKGAEEHHAEVVDELLRRAQRVTGVVGPLAGGGGGTPLGEPQSLYQQQQQQTPLAPAAAAAAVAGPAASRPVHHSPVRHQNVASSMRLTGRPQSQLSDTGSSGGSSSGNSSPTREIIGAEGRGDGRGEGRGDGRGRGEAGGQAGGIGLPQNANVVRAVTYLLYELEDIDLAHVAKVISDLRARALG
jgi:hypothetical protein